MDNLLIQYLAATWLILVEAAPYVLGGFAAAGLVRALLPDELVARHLGGNSAGAVVKASLLGVPLPLCSCGVIPAAIGLRRQGAGRGPTAAFLVSTPETGVDSVAITWALLDPLMTVLRPLSAFVTATVTGLLINRLPEEQAEPNVEAPTCGCSSCEAAPPERPLLTARLRDGVRYAFTELLGDIGGWLLLGIAIAGLLTVLVPPQLLAPLFEQRFLSLLLMLVVGIPMYICASASTPIAAALVLKGLSPGAALVFLLAGPATNAATITVVTRFWGRRTTLVYLAAIAGCAVTLGWLTDQLYLWSGVDISHWVHQASEATPAWWEHAVAGLLVALIAWQLWPRQRGGGCGCDDGSCRE
jgi:uncharacterized membrane protein YraQ (UPF0718 family)